MFTYQKDMSDIVYQVKVDEKLYLLFEQEDEIELLLGNWCLLTSSRLGSEQVANRFIEMSADLFTQAERFGIVKRRLQGNDARFIDVIDLENPDTELVNTSSVLMKVDQKKKEESLPDDYCGVLLTMIRLCKRRVQFYEFINKQTSDKAMLELMNSFILKLHYYITIYQEMLSEIGVEDEQRKFKDNYEGDRSFDYDSENYFDPKNPLFYPAKDE